MYGKIFERMYDGTLDGHWEAIVTMQQLIVLADSAGFVDMTIRSISKRTSIPEDIIERGIEHLLLPDRYSRTQGEEGRRIIPMDEHRPWGWMLVNYVKYSKMQKMADKQNADRQRMADKRLKDKALQAPKNDSVADCSIPSQIVPNVRDVAHVDVDVNVDVDVKEKEKGRQQVATISPLAKSADADDYREFASRMWISIQSLTNQQKAPNLETWADEIRKLIEIDRQPLSVAWEVFNWANKDKFWQGNILSAANFRKHFPKLYAQSRGDAPVDFSAIARNHKDIF